MTQHTSAALKVPALLVAVIFLWRTSVTLAQCELYEVAKLTAADAAASDLFGYSVSVSGDVAVAGAWRDDCAAGVDCGAAYVYRLIGSTWVQEGKLTASDAAQSDVFGLSVFVSGDVAILGAHQDDCAAGLDCGSAYVYRFNGSTWVEQAKLTASDAAAGDAFGNSVSVSGDVAVAGASFDDCAGGSNCGSAYVYRLNGSGWVQEDKLTASDAAQEDYFGQSVSVSGNLVVVGAYLDNCAAGIRCGSAFVYRFNGTTWVEEQKLTASDAAQSDQFGFSVSVSGDLVVVGAYLDDCAAGIDCGSAYIYRFNGSGWVQEAKLTALNAAQLDLFGQSVSVSGDIAVVGARGDDCATGLDCGAAYVYRFNGSFWLLQAKFTPSDAAQQDYFGWSASVSGNLVVVGADQDDCAAGVNCGSAYVLALENLPLPADCNANGIADECETDCNANQVPDDCDIMGGASDDCNDNGVPDECESQADCNNNGTQDICDVAEGTSLDCNRDEVPDECQLALNDCNGNLIPDDCESSTDCNNNAVRDFCDLAVGTSEDCNSNVVPDECDITNGTSTDVNNNGIPDECDTNMPPFIIGHPVDQTVCEGETVIFTVQPGGMSPFTYQWRQDTADLPGESGDTLTRSGVIMGDAGDYDVVVTNDLGSTISDAATLTVIEPTALVVAAEPNAFNRNRYITFLPPQTPCLAAIRVRLVSLQHPDPPNSPMFPPLNYSAYESGPTCTDPGGCVRWVGPPGVFLEIQEDPSWGTFQASMLQCTPYYHNWNDGGLLSVTGSEIVPSSEYEVQALAESCAGMEASCGDVSPSLLIATARWADVQAPRNPPSSTTQPDAIDITMLVNKFKAYPGALSNTVVQLQPNVPNVNADVNAVDIVTCVDAFKGRQYPFSGPCPCPSAVPCHATPCANSGNCTGPYGALVSCVRECVGGLTEGARCSSDRHCRHCEGGSADGRPCFNNANCPGGTCPTGPVCGAGYCRDNCVRCSPP